MSARTRRFSAGDVDRVKPWSLTREQTIDLMERRQEAAVMKYVREISRLSEEGNWQIETPRKRPRRESAEMAANKEAVPKTVDFGKMNSAQIAVVMQDEQAAMESRLKQTVVSLQAERHRRRYESVSF
ncbi:uncharacterized protein CXQ87_005070 [Candidozyma duobushaemuli]|uniref:Uncharacterized protein n=1 Tax=Candidozyma duobushaemuli TaxID=1231522 RepID=A0A2V1ABC6_9ASCO|nr:uncharacterized protein CXQ87_005070 [[Candida] duobushaemulonis]PVH14794.1 hypothetical protein CXQ87_005070 [[Candida] duobushaemulonis]